MIDDWIHLYCRMDKLYEFGLDDIEQALVFLKEHYYRDAHVLTTVEAIERINGKGELSTSILKPWMEHQKRLVKLVYGL